MFKSTAYVYSIRIPKKNSKQQSNLQTLSYHYVQAKKNNIEPHRKKQTIQMNIIMNRGVLIAQRFMQSVLCMSLATSTILVQTIYHTLVYLIASSIFFGFQASDFEPDTNIFLLKYTHKYLIIFLVSVAYEDCCCYWFGSCASH